MGHLDKLKYCGFRDKGKNVHLYCPILDGKIKSFKLRKAIYKEFKELEKFVSKHYQYAVMYTKINHDGMIRIVTKLGYRPYYVNLEYNSIWFKKEF